MRKVLLWPAVVLLFWIGNDVYFRVRPCTGLFAGMCGLTDMIVKGMLVESIVVYALIAFAMTKVRRRKKKQVTGIEYFFAGIVSVGIVFGGILLSGHGITASIGEYDSYPGAAYFAVSAPFVVLPMFITEWIAKLRF